MCSSDLSAWADRTPFGHDVRQSEADRQPTLHSEGANGKPAVIFDGADDVLGVMVNGARLLSGDAASLFIVMKQDRASANNAVLGWESNSHLNHLDLLFTYNDQLLFDYGNVSAGGRILAPQPERWDDLWNLVEVYRTGESGRVAVAGETVFSDTFAGELDVEVDGALTLGGVGGLHFGGAVAEVLVYNRALSEAEITRVRSVMATKFDLPVSANQEPTVVLTKPATGVSLKAGKTLQLAASANDADGSVVKVRFLLGGQVIGEDTEAPYELEWTPTEAGEVQLSAVGCLEMYVSAKGIRKSVNELKVKNPDDTFIQSLPEKGLDGRVLDKAFDAGERAAIELYQFTGEKLGIGLAQAATLLSPEAFIIYGGYSNAGERLLEPARRAMDEYLLSSHKGKILILQSSLPQSEAGIIGAASLIWSPRTV